MNSRMTAESDARWVASKYYIHVYTVAPFYKTTPTKSLLLIRSDLGQWNTTKLSPSREATPLIGPLFHCRTGGFIRMWLLYMSEINLLEKLHFQKNTSCRENRQNSTHCKYIYYVYFGCCLVWDRGHWKWDIGIGFPAVVMVLTMSYLCDLISFSIAIQYRFTIFGPQILDSGYMGIFMHMLP